MRRYILSFFLSQPALAFAQNYAVFLIPDSLLKNADAVQRTEETRIIIHSVNSATIKTKHAYTILNEKGNEFARYDCLYDNFEKLNDVSGKLFNALGLHIKSVKKKDMEDKPYDDNFSLIGDARIKSHDFYCRDYPYTVEYEQEVELKGIYEFPSWYPVSGTNYSVQHSRFSIEMPADYHLRYKLLHGANEPLINTTDKVRTLQWTAENMLAIVHEPFQPSVKSLMPGVLVGPTDFEYGGYSGNLSTWNNYGKFYAELNKGRDILPDEIKKQVHALTDALTDKSKKINVLYQFMQQNTHYISIQLGIGGLQTFEASYVAEKKYGDCKALSNYMVSLLKEAGIKANTVIIYGGKSNREFYADFPKHYFNHVVACVPGDNDTTWLECTSQSESAGYSGSFTGNRQALMVTENGGLLVNTPSYGISDNLQRRLVSANIDESGNLYALVSTHFTGIQQELQHDLLNEANAEQRQKYLNSKLNLPTYKVDKIEYRETKGKIPAMDEYMTINAENYAIITGKRLFIIPNLFNKTNKLPPEDKRKFPVEFRESYRDIDSISIRIPPGYTIESMPKDVDLNDAFGKYQINYKMNGDSIQLVRIMEQKSFIFPASEYQHIISHFDTIYKADRAKLVFVKKEI